MNIQEFIVHFKSQLENENYTINPETNYVNSEFWDSLTSMVVSVMIDDEFGVKMLPEEINKYDTIQDLFDAVQNLQK